MRTTKLKVAPRSNLNSALASLPAAMVRLACASAMGALLAGCLGVTTVGQPPVYVDPASANSRGPCPTQAEGSQETSPRPCGNTQPK